MTNPRIAWLSSGQPDEDFPPISTALSEPDGLLAAGGDLSTPRLLAAYQRGIFPWYDEGQPILWWAPDPRCVFLPGDFHASRRLRRSLRRSDAEIRVNTEFSSVLEACAGPRRHEQGTWITDDMRIAYERLHGEGWAHSIEVWEDDALVGGLYGLAIGAAFFGESMFSRSPNASKSALVYLSNRLVAGDFALLDCQVISTHLLSLGARTIARSEFADRLRSAIYVPKQFENWTNAPIKCSRLLDPFD